MAITYCNTTTDLVDAYRDIEGYRRYSTLSGWELYSGAVYKIDQAGYTEMVFQNGVEMTAGTNTSLSASEFFYEDSSDILYVRCAADADPSGITMESGVSWDTVKTRARNDAQEMLEGMLRQVYAVPFQKIPTPETSYNSRDYDYWIRRAAALLTCALLVRKMNPDDAVADKLYLQVDNPRVQGIISDDPPGIVQRLLEGDIVLRTQRTAREAGGWNVFETIAANSSGVLELYGNYNGSTEEVWRIHIDTAGAPGTATYKLSYDQGGTFDFTLQPTRTSGADSQRVNIGGSIEARFSGTFILNDYFDVHLFPSTDRVTASRVGSIPLERNG